MRKGLLLIGLIALLALALPSPEGMTVFRALLAPVLGTLAVFR